MSIPYKDSELSPYATNWDTRISAAPATWLLSAGDATALSDVVEPYVTSYNTMMQQRNSGIRSKPLVDAKNTARDNLLVVLKALYARIQANALVSDENKALLNITVRKPNTPVPVPTSVPKIDFKSVVGYRVTINVHGEDSNHRGFAAGIKGVNIYSFIGAEPSGDPADWFFQGAITRSSDIEIVFPSTTTPGAKVWFRAAFFNPRNQAGDACDPVYTHLQFMSGSMQQAA